ncbi:MAG: iron chaperone [Gaiellaceae bacterium]|jgi:uncharacterized protein YdhG (YjbR/CyaY superfamily)
MSTAKKSKKSDGFTAEEKAAMRARAREVKANEDGERAVRTALDEMSADDRALGERIHAIVKETAPELTPKTWYGMPAYANRDGKVVVFFRNAEKFKERYAMLGFNDTASLDDGSMWPVAFALTKLTKSDEARIRALVKQAVS